MVLAVRRGSSLRHTAQRFGVSLGTVQYWVGRAKGQRLGRVEFANRPSGTRRAANRTSISLERRILSLRAKLKKSSALGHHGAIAIRQALLADDGKAPCARTIGRILLRNGALDFRRRQRHPPPPRGWYLPTVAAGQAEIDSIDTICDLSIKNGPTVTILNAMSLHGGLPASWPEDKISSKTVEKHLLSHWRLFGLPHFAKFDNDVIFQGPHHWPNTFGRITRLCLQLQVTPVFVPPREPGFQAEIEAFNGRWQRAVWQRFMHRDLEDLRNRTRLFLDAAREHVAPRMATAPERRQFPEEFVLDYQRPLSGTVVFLRRSNARGVVDCLGGKWPVDAAWVHRLVRIEVDLTVQELRFYRLRRREPGDQPLMKTVHYPVARKPFRG